MFRDTGVTTLPAVEALHVSVHDLSTDEQRMSHVVRKHLRLESDAYDAAIRTFIPGYEEALTRAANEIAGVRPTLVLDLGTGTGALAEALLAHDRVGAVEALDIDPEMLAQARLRLTRFGTRARVRRGSFEAPLPPCDAVATSLALHHVPTMARKRRLYARILPGAPSRRRLRQRRRGHQCASGGARGDVPSMGHPSGVVRY